MYPPVIEIEQLSKAYHDHPVLHDVSLKVHDGEFLTLLGPSGCGKTTLLRLISGFELPSSGAIKLHGKDIVGLPPERRHVNTVFQSYALFPHMTVFDNVAFGLECQKMAKAQIKQRVDEMLAVVKLDKHSARKPTELSGGQQQRVAIARALVNHPAVLLLDEPLSSLDYRLRKNMQIELKQLQRQLGITFIFVTHDQEEALSMSDRVVVMHEGMIAQIGTPREIYETPNSLAVAKFIGEVNVFETVVSALDANAMTLQVEGKSLHLPLDKHTGSLEISQPVHLLLRPEDLHVWDRTEVQDTSEMLPGTVEEVIYKGSTVDLIIRLHSGKKILATEFFDENDEDLAYTKGESVWLEWKSGWEVVLPRES